MSTPTCQFVWFSVYKTQSAYQQSLRCYEQLKQQMIIGKFIPNQPWNVEKQPHKWRVWKQDVKLHQPENQVRWDGVRPLPFSPLTSWLSWDSPCCWRPNLRRRSERANGDGWERDGEKKRVSGDSTTVWLLARGAISRLRSHRKLQMPYFTKHLAAETKLFRLHHERLSDGNMKRKKLLRPVSGCRLWSSDGFIIQQTESPNTQALRGETLRRENRETLQYGEGSRFP